MGLRIALYHRFHFCLHQIIAEAKPKGTPTSFTSIRSKANFFLYRYLYKEDIFLIHRK